MIDRVIIPFRGFTAEGFFLLLGSFIAFRGCTAENFFLFSGFGFFSENGNTDAARQE